MSKSFPDLNPSSLLNLKAELSKKYESFKNAKLNQKSDTVKRSLLKSKGSAALNKEDKKSKESDSLAHSLIDDQSALEKMRLEKLEAKAKLYDKIVSSKVEIDDEQKELYLVDFDKKVLYESKSNVSKPISQIDSENDCKTHTVETNIFQDRNYATGANTEKNRQDNSSDSIRNNLTDNYKTSEAVHYQDVLQNEVRDHGTAYFAFSTDEEKRKQQMEELNSLKLEADTQRKTKQNLQKRRAAMLQARLSKVCERRNINQSVINNFAPKTEYLEDPTEITANEVDLEAIPLPEQKPKIEDSEKKVPKIRPWDIGKTDLLIPSPKKRKMKSDSEWVEEQRSERPSEFAPPSWY